MRVTKPSTCGWTFVERRDFDGSDELGRLLDAVLGERQHLDGHGGRAARRGLRAAAAGRNHGERQQKDDRTWVHGLQRFRSGVTVG